MNMKNQNFLQLVVSLKRQQKELRGLNQKASRSFNPQRRIFYRVLCLCWKKADPLSRLEYRLRLCLNSLQETIQTIVELYRQKSGEITDLEMALESAERWRPCDFRTWIINNLKLKDFQVNSETDKLLRGNVLPDSKESTPDYGLDLLEEMRLILQVQVSVLGLIGEIGNAAAQMFEDGSMRFILFLNLIDPAKVIDRTSRLVTALGPISEESMREIQAHLGRSVSAIEQSVRSLGSSQDRKTSLRDLANSVEDQRISLAIQNRAKLGG